jgi:hypothetical protein
VVGGIIHLHKIQIMSKMNNLGKVLLKYLQTKTFLVPHKKDLFDKDLMKANEVHNQKPKLTKVVFLYLFWSMSFLFIDNCKFLKNIKIFGFFNFIYNLCSYTFYFSYYIIYIFKLYLNKMILSRKLSILLTVIAFCSILQGHKIGVRLLPLTLKHF